MYTIYIYIYNRRDKTYNLKKSEIKPKKSQINSKIITHKIKL